MATSGGGSDNGGNESGDDGVMLVVVLMLVVNMVAMVVAAVDNAMVRSDLALTYPTTNSSKNSFIICRRNRSRGLGLEYKKSRF